MPQRRDDIKSDAFSARTPALASQDGQQASASSDGGKVSAPSISLPKGGGAIRGIGEKFAANPVTGTGSMTVPIATSPGRSGFGPQLSLSYDSGAGNGPFGFGWSLSLPSITRKTDKGLPQYRDSEQSDVFILSGAEDLVPVFRQDQTGNWIRDDKGDLVIHEDERDGYLVRRYRPRIEGLFARIERWTNLGSGEIYWRSISRDNITTFYGKTAESRIADPDDSTHVFSWLICESYDDKGNAIVYEYAEEDSQGVDLSQANERNRTDTSRSANRYLKRIMYGNKTSRLLQPDLSQMSWLFEVVFDYDEGHLQELPLDAEEHQYVQAALDKTQDWSIRKDPFSSYRAGFEVRTYRLCRRVLMFHHFPDELRIDDYLVRSTEFAYKESPIASFIVEVTQSGYVLQNGKYLKKSLPPLEFKYTEAEICYDVNELDSESLENLPYGVDGSNYQWVDLDGEGVSGILTEQANVWFYKRNLSPNNLVPVNGTERTAARFGPLELVATKPAASLAGHAQFMDLAGDGQVDLVQMDGPVRGFYERTDDADWESFRPFESWPNVDTRDPNLRFVDLDGDGHSDILITENEVLSWYPSLAEKGFGSVQQVRNPLDEEKGPRLVFADGTQSVYLADLSGDGLTDLVRIRNGEVCYWPNLGYGRFGAKVTMDKAPWFDYPDQFNQQRIRLADIDGSGTTDIIYLGRDRIDIYRNETGNSWSAPEALTNFPPVDNLSAVMAVDLLGNGTACLVWSSPLPADAHHPMRYIDLMGEQKPHLLNSTKNNLGAETRVHYAPSTKFYLDDKASGKPWITRLPFPVHVVERVETYDHISRNRFVTRYAYHHGYFDGVEREFRGFGMVEQWDTEEFAALSNSADFPTGDNINKASHVPPVLTKTWFHTGVYDEVDEVSQHFATEYYGAPEKSDPNYDAAFEAFFQTLLADTVIPSGLTLDEEREACRALKGSMLRQEVYAFDDTAKALHPYIVTEQNFTIRHLQPQADNRHAVFFTHACEAITYHYERNPVDPRVGHVLTLEVDAFGNVGKSLSIGYRRRQGQSPLQDEDKKRQEQTLITYTENEFTNAINDTAVYPDDYRTPLPCETRTYEVTGFSLDANDVRFSFEKFANDNFQALLALPEIEYEQPTDYTKKQKRLIERVRTLYRKDDLSALLGKCMLQPMALPGESYKLAFTPGLLDQVYVRGGQKLLPANPADVLEGGGADRGGYVDLDGNGHWWIPSGRVFFSGNADDTPFDELAFARVHFFLPHRYRDPFHTKTVRTETIVTYDSHDLLIVETRDPLDNVVTLNTQDDSGNAAIRNDYRVLQPYWITDPNGNRSKVAFDALGMVVGTAVMGKVGENQGDLLDESFIVDLEDETVLEHLDKPLSDPYAILQKATTRLVYDLLAYQRTKNDEQPQPVVAYTLARETHHFDRVQNKKTKVQHSFSYSDGFGREIQKKIQAEPEKINGEIGPPRWVGSGWTIFNNKGKPVRQYEPFFSELPPEEGHHFEFGKKVGVSTVLFYDPVDRVVATLHPNHTYEKVVFDPWWQETWDVNDTIKAPDNPGDPPFDPKNDPDVGHYFSRLSDDEYLPTWYDLRTDADKALKEWPDTDAQGQPLPDNAKRRTAEKGAAEKAVKHAGTPTVAHFDTLGRVFLTFAHNRVVCAGHDLDGSEDSFATRVELDIEGNQRAVRDERKLPINYLPTGAIEQRLVMRYAYDMLGNRIHQLSMEAGARWMLNDVAGKPIRAWDSRGHNFTTTYDALRRPVEQTVSGTTEESDPRTLNRNILVDKIEYGEGIANADELYLRTRIYRHFDSAGIVTNARLDAGGNPTEAYDFKGNLLRSTRRLVSDYKAIPDWLLNPQLDGETFEGSTRYDALNRPLQSVAPHSSLGRGKFNVIQPVFNEANLLERVDVWLERATEPEALLDSNTEQASRVGVANIDYDAKGQRLRIDYKNGASTFYDYDELTFRLTHLYTRRGTAFTEDCDNPTPPPSTIAAPDTPPQGKACGLQNLHYTYDPVGNITHIQDDAQQTIYFRNKCVEPSNDYTYDALYRLIQANGREHLGQGGAPIPHSYDDEGRVGLPHPNDCNAMGTYIERYVYDAVGNFFQMQHRGSDSSHPGWTRRYEYNEPSLIEPAKQSNRLSLTQVGNGTTAAPERYAYDLHGNMVRMPNLQVMQWDFKDQLQMTQRQKVNGQDADGVLHHGERTWYVYDSAGQRVRKVTELPNNGGLKDERIYLGGFEIFRKHGGTIGANSATLERETLHVMDDKQRIALVETRTLDTAGNDQAPRQLIRYQFGNHLGSTSLELDDQAQIVSYEEYAPFGSSTYQALRSQTETAKQYRYTGKERDDESGLHYHGARYYAVWLGRWVSADPDIWSWLVERDDAKTDSRQPLSSFIGMANNPMIHVDVNGKQENPVDIIEGVSVARRSEPGVSDIVSDIKETEHEFGFDLGEGWKADAKRAIEASPKWEVGAEIYRELGLAGQIAELASQLLYREGQVDKTGKLVGGEGLVCVHFLNFFGAIWFSGGPQGREKQEPYQDPVTGEAKKRPLIEVYPRKEKYGIKQVISSPVRWRKLLKTLEALDKDQLYAIQKFNDEGAPSHVFFLVYHEAEGWLRIESTGVLPKKSAKGPRILSGPGPGIYRAKSSGTGSYLAWSWGPAKKPRIEGLEERYQLKPNPDKPEPKKQKHTQRR